MSISIICIILFLFLLLCAITKHLLFGGFSTSYKVLDDKTHDDKTHDKIVNRCYDIIFPLVIFRRNFSIIEYDSLLFRYPFSIKTDARELENKIKEKLCKSRDDIFKKQLEAMIEYINMYIADSSHEYICDGSEKYPDGIINVLNKNSAYLAFLSNLSSEEKEYIKEIYGIRYYEKYDSVLIEIEEYKRNMTSLEHQIILMSVYYYQALQYTIYSKGYLSDYYSCEKYKNVIANISSYLYIQSKLSSFKRIPVLDPTEINAASDTVCFTIMENADRIPRADNPNVSTISKVIERYGIISDDIKIDINIEDLVASANKFIAKFHIMDYDESISDITLDTNVERVNAKNKLLHETVSVLPDDVVCKPVNMFWNHAVDLSQQDAEDRVDTIALSWETYPKLNVYSSYNYITQYEKTSLAFINLLIRLLNLVERKSADGYYYYCFDIDPTNIGFTEKDEKCLIIDVDFIRTKDPKGKMLTIVPDGVVTHSPFINYGNFRNLSISDAYECYIMIQYIMYYTRKENKLFRIVPDTGPWDQDNDKYANSFYNGVVSLIKVKPTKWYLKREQQYLINFINNKSTSIIEGYRFPVFPVLAWLSELCKIDTTSS